MAGPITIKNLMTAKVVTVYPDTPLLAAVDIMLKNNFSGLPVVNRNGTLAGILTEHDLTIKGSLINLPTFLKLLKEFEIYRQDKKFIDQNVKKIFSMKVEDAMNPNPFSLHQNVSLEEAIHVFSEHQAINPIPVVDDNNKVVGILSRYDLIKLMGSPSVTFASQPDERELDKNVNKFLMDFGNRFVIVSRSRLKYWLIASVLFLIVGFVIAFALMVRVVLK